MLLVLVAVVDNMPYAVAEAAVSLPFPCSGLLSQHSARNWGTCLSLVCASLLFSTGACTILVAVHEEACQATAEPR